MASTLAQHRRSVPFEYVNEEGGTSQVTTIDGVSPVGGDINLTGGDGITITNPATNEIQIAVTDTEVVQTVNTLSPVAGDIIVTSGTGLAVTSAGNTVTVALDDAARVTEGTVAGQTMTIRGAWTDLNMPTFAPSISGYYRVTAEVDFRYRASAATAFQVGFRFVLANGASSITPLRLTLGNDAVSHGGDIQDYMTIGGVAFCDDTNNTLDLQYWINTASGSITVAATDLVTYNFTLLMPFTPE
ncbi:MAG: hypothetical protein ACPGR8_06430 [Limisphaerales bacterium]